MSAANGLLEMSTFAAIVLGTSVGGALYERWHGEPFVMAGALMAIAVVGFVTSLGVPAGARGQAGRASVDSIPWAEVWRGTVRLWPDATLWGTILGIAYFWFLGALLQTALLPFGQQVLHVSNEAAHAALHAPRLRHRDRQPRRGTALRREDRAGPRPARLVRSRHLRHRVRVVVDLSRRHHHARSAGILRRILRRAAQRAAPAAAGRRRKRPRPGDQQLLPDHWHPDRRRVAGVPELGGPVGPAHSHDRRHLHAAHELLHPGAAAGFLRAIHVVDPHAHDLPDQDRRPAEHSGARTGAAHRQSRVDGRWRADRCVHSALRAFHGLRAVLPAAAASIS